MDKFLKLGRNFKSRMFINIDHEKLQEAIKNSKNHAACAKYLNISRNTLYTRLEQHNLKDAFSKKRLLKKLNRTLTI